MHLKLINFILDIKFILRQMCLSRLASFTFTMAIRNNFQIKGVLSNVSLFVIYPAGPGAEPGTSRTPGRSSAAEPDSDHSKQF